MLVVLDTNVIISAMLIKHSLPRTLFDLQKAGRYKLLLSEDILAEYRRVLCYPHIQRRHQQAIQQVERFLTSLRKTSSIVEPTEHVMVVHDDPSDNMFLSCALAGNAEYIVSGDRDLLDVQAYRGIRILSPAQFLRLLEQEKAA